MLVLTLLILILLWGFTNVILKQDENTIHTMYGHSLGLLSLYPDNTYVQKLEKMCDEDAQVLLGTRGFWMSYINISFLSLIVLIAVMGVLVLRNTSTHGVVLDAKEA